VAVGTYLPSVELLLLLPGHQLQQVSTFQLPSALPAPHTTPLGDPEASVDTAAAMEDLNESSAEAMGPSEGGECDPGSPSTSAEAVAAARTSAAAEGMTAAVAVVAAVARVGSSEAAATVRGLVPESMHVTVDSGPHSSVQVRLVGHNAYM